MGNRIGRGWLLVGLALAPAPALAEMRPPPEGTIRERPSRAARVGMPGEESAMGTIRGTVQGIDLTQGLVTLTSGEQVLTLQGTPGLLSAIGPGDDVALQFGSFNGVLWMAPSGTGMKQAATAPGIGNAMEGFEGRYRSQGAMSGTVQALDRDAGIFTVRGTAFRGHPLALAQLQPGQSVRLSYANVGGVNWVRALSPESAPIEPGAAGDAPAPLPRGSGVGKLPDVDEPPIREDPDVTQP